MSLVAHRWAPLFCSPLARSLAAVSLALGIASVASAVCDVIPATSASFRGALAEANRPFAMPGSTIRLLARPQACPDAPFDRGHDEDGNLTIEAADYFVSTVFEPPDPGAVRHVVVTSTNCASLDWNTCVGGSRPGLPCQASAVCGGGSCTGPTKTAECQGTLNAIALGSSVRCAQVASPDYLVSIGTFDEATIRFPFPDTDQDVAGDKRTLTGPATLAVSGIMRPLPCDLATTPSLEAAETAPGRCASTGKLLACVDELYPKDVACDIRRSRVDKTLGHFTALPPANDLSVLCDESGSQEEGCTNGDDAIRLTVDKDGNVLVPIDYSGIRVYDDDLVPLTRLVRAALTVDAFAPAPNDPLQLAGKSFLKSFSARGYEVAPLSAPLIDANDPQASNALFGSVDANVGIIWLARRGKAREQCLGGGYDGKPCNLDKECGPGNTCGEATCVGGSHAGLACSDDFECAPGGECGPSNFRFSDRLWSGVGPVLLDDDDVTIDMEGTAPLEGLFEDEDLFAFFTSEKLAGVGDKNSDGDSKDHVLLVRDRKTGHLQSLGTAEGGLAAGQISRATFRRPAVATGGDLVAFLEPEALSCNLSGSASGCGDVNGDGDFFDLRVRAYQVSDAGAVDKMQGAVLTADAAPVIDGEPIAVSDGLVFFRTREAETVPDTTQLMSVDNQGFVKLEDSDAVEISADGRYVTFQSSGMFLTPDAGPDEDVFLRDRDRDGNGIFDETSCPPATTCVQTRRISWGYDNTDSNGYSKNGAMSANGRYVAFDSYATNLLTPPAVDNNGERDVFVRDLDADNDGSFYAQNPATGYKNIRVSVTSTGGASSGGGSFAPVISASGRFVAFKSYATNLAGPVASGRLHIYLHDRDFDSDGILDETHANARRTVLIDKAPGGEEANVDATRLFGISDDGRFVLIGSKATNLTGDGNTYGAIIHDRDSDRNDVFDEVNGIANVPLCVTDDGAPAAEGCGGSLRACLSGNGRFAAFGTLSASLASSDKLTSAGVVLRDRDPDEDGIFDEPGQIATDRIDFSNEDDGGNGTAAWCSISSDGRFVTFLSGANNLVPGIGASEGAGAVIRDRQAGTTKRVGVGFSGPTHPIPIPSNAFLSLEARSLAFSSDAVFSGLGGTNNGARDVFVAGPPNGPSPKDLDGDGRMTSTVLRARDTQGGGTTYNLGAASSASVHGANAVLIRESDSQVFLWSKNQPGVLSPLGLAAEQVAISDAWIVALVSEAKTDVDANSDNDKKDRVLMVRSIGGPSSINLGRAADSFRLEGDLLAFSTREDQQGSTLATQDATGDGDALDRYIELYRLGSTPTAYVIEAGSPLKRQPVEDYVLGSSGPQLLAFRSREAAFCNNSTPPASSTTCAPGGCTDCDRNGDGDCCDDVMQVFEQATGAVQSTRMAAQSCTGASCDPRKPYRVYERTVTFLTHEASQGVDLDEDDGQTSLLLHSFTTPPTATPTPERPAVIARSTTGVCTSSGLPCASESECTGGACIVPPGVCVQDLGLPCNADVEDDMLGPVAGCGTPSDPLASCRPTAAGSLVGTCFKAIAGSACSTNSNCPSNLCEGSGQRAVKLLPAVQIDGSGGAEDARQVLASAGLCREISSNPPTTCNPTAQPTGCGPAERCVVDRCYREHDACANDADCAAGSCTFDSITTLGGADTDFDGVVDPIDNCFEYPNPSQGDLDEDGIGDACDAYICGDGAVQNMQGPIEDREECDDGNRMDGDGCDARCQKELPDCADGIDDDGDGLVDYPADPGCQNELSFSREDPECSNGIDDDSDGRIDYSSISSVSDPQCASTYDDTESPDPVSPSGCGLLGIEPLLLVAGIALLRSARTWKLRAGRA